MNSFSCIKEFNDPLFYSSSVVFWPVQSRPVYSSFLRMHQIFGHSTLLLSFLSPLGSYVNFIITQWMGTQTWALRYNAPSMHAANFKISLIGTTTQLSSLQLFVSLSDCIFKAFLSLGGLESTFQTIKRKWLDFFFKLEKRKKCLKLTKKLHLTFCETSQVWTWITSWLVYSKSNELWRMYTLIK